MSDQIKDKTMDNDNNIKLQRNINLEKAKSKQQMDEYERVNDLLISLDKYNTYNMLEAALIKAINYEKLYDLAMLANANNNQEIQYLNSKILIYEDNANINSDKYNKSQYENALANLENEYKDRLNNTTKELSENKIKMNTLEKDIKEKIQKTTKYEEDINTKMIDLQNKISNLKQPYELINNYKIRNEEVFEEFKKLNKKQLENFESNKVKYENQLNQYKINYDEIDNTKTNLV